MLHKEIFTSETHKIYLVLLVIILLISIFHFFCGYYIISVKNFLHFLRSIASSSFIVGSRFFPQRFFRFTNRLHFSCSHHNSKKNDEYSQTVTGTATVTRSHVPLQRRYFIERLVAALMIAVVDHLTVHAKRFPVLLSLMSNEMIFAEESLVTVLILTHKILEVCVPRTAAITHRCHWFLTTIEFTPLQK